MRIAPGVLRSLNKPFTDVQSTFSRVVTLLIIGLEYSWFVNKHAG